MDAEPTVRLAREADVELCGRICFDAFADTCRRHGYDPDFPSVEAATRLWDALVQHPKVLAVVADIDGDILACNALDIRCAVVAVGPLTVRPGVQNHGVGRALMAYVIARANRLDRVGIRLVQAAYNGRSLALYASLGFEVREEFVLLTGVMAGVAPVRRRESAFVRIAEREDQAACDVICERTHGFDRHDELADAIAGGTAKVVERGDEIVGYATNMGFFGHAVANTGDDLRALIAATPHIEHPGLLLPLRDADTLRWALQSGLRVNYTMNLMTMGRYQVPTGPYLASIGF